MNLFALILKQMRQRMLSSCLTILSVMLGVALASAVLVANKHSQDLFLQSNYGYNLLIGIRGSKITLVLNSIYDLDKSQGSIPYSIYEGLQNEAKERYVESAVPFMVGDTFRSYRILATTSEIFGLDDAGQPLPPKNQFHYDLVHGFSFAQGNPFHPKKFEAVLGSDVAEKTGVKLGEQVWLEHGGVSTDIHDERWTVVGVLQPTHTAMDRTVFIPLLSCLAIPDHEEGLVDMANAHAPGSTATTEPTAATKAPSTQPHEKPYDLDPKTGELTLKVPKSDWRLNGIFVRTVREGTAGEDLLRSFNNDPDSPAMAVYPAAEMKAFFMTFLRPATLVLLGVTVFASVIAALSILVSIYNSIMGRRREIAILRALGATRMRVLTLICLEAGLIGCIGTLLGLTLGHGVAQIAMSILQKQFGSSGAALSVDISEAYYGVGVIAVSFVAGLVPAMKAYRTSVAENLVAE